MTGFQLVLLLARFQDSARGRKGNLRLAEHQVARPRIDVGTRGCRRSSDDHGLPPGPGGGDDIKRVMLLRQHAAQHDHVGPLKIRLFQVLDIAVHESQLPRLREQGRHGDESERGLSIPRVKEAHASRKSQNEDPSNRGWTSRQRVPRAGIDQDLTPAWIGGLVLCGRDSGFMISAIRKLLFTIARSRTPSRADSSRRVRI